VYLEDKYPRTSGSAIKVSWVVLNLKMIWAVFARRSAIKRRLAPSPAIIEISYMAKDVTYEIAYRWNCEISVEILRDCSVRKTDEAGLPEILP
jgi:hypothetical protein